MTDLTEFLLARIAGDAAGATAARDARPVYGHYDETAFGELLELGANEGGSDQALAHAGRWSPSRVLAECEAKRRIIDRDDGHTNNWASDLDSDPGSRVAGAFCLLDREPWPCETVRLLALPYADHPDYRDEWRP